MLSSVRFVLVCYFFTTLFLSHGSPVSLSLPSTASLLSTVTPNLRQVDERHSKNLSCIEPRNFLCERNSAESSLRRTEEGPVAKIPLVAAFLTPLSASLSAVRHSMETGVDRCSAVVKRSADTAKKPISLLSSLLSRVPTLSPPQEGAIPVALNISNEAAPCSHHVVHRKISIDARCVSTSASRI
jgi:hypothetical protein